MVSNHKVAADLSAIANATAALASMVTDSSNQFVLSF